MDLTDFRLVDGYEFVPFVLIQTVNHNFAASKLWFRQLLELLNFRDFWEQV
jgi:hypothetical protein